MIKTKLSFRLYQKFLYKYLLVMKITTLLLILTSLQISASVYSQNTKVNIKARNNSIIEIFNEIERQSEFRIFYKTDMLDLNKKYDFDVKEISVSEVLNNLLSNSNTSYKLVDKIIVITPVKNGIQQQKVSGTVSDAVTGEALLGVNIIIESTTIGTVTDYSGKFSIDLPAQNSVLVISSVGYNTERIEVAGRNNLDVKLVPDIKSLEEVVVVGYGTQLKKEVTGAVTSIKEESFNKGAITNSPLQLVQGKIAGLAISRNSGGDPTAGVQMQVRGVSTVRGSEAPLVIIDGIPGGNLNTIVPEDVESIDVLRDGAAAAIYGTRGTNGVVLVTTKRGKAGKPTVEYSAYAYTETWAKKPEVLNGDDWRKMKTDFLNSGNQTLINKASSLVDYGGNTDWFNEITKKSISSVHNLSISGGSETTKYHASLNYRDLNGFIRESSNDIWNGRISLTHKGLKDKLEVQMNLAGTSRTGHPINYRVYREAMQRNPTLTVYNPDGTFNENSSYGGEYANPVAMLKQTQDDQQRSEMLASTMATLEIIDGLKFSTTIALQKYNEINGYYLSRDNFQSIQSGSMGEANRSAAQNVDRTLESMLNYVKSVNGIHNINIMGGYSYQDFVYEQFSASNRYFITDAFGYNNLAAGLQLQDNKYRNGDVSSYKNASRLIALFGRVNYNFKGKYLASLSLRREGSSKFGSEKKWGMFPAVSLGWNISEENFMKGLSFINNLKLRAGYGITGNQGIGNYISLERLSPAGMMLYQGVWIPGYGPSSNPNPDLQWEKKSEKNIGLDMSILNERLSFNLDLYNRTTTDLLYEYSVPVPPNLFNRIWTNVGKMSNKGIELTINATPLKVNGFTWTTNFNISYNKNKLETLSNNVYQTKFQDLQNIGNPGLNSTPAFRLEEGQPVGNMFAYKFAGLTDDGKWLFWDKANTKKLKSNEAKYEDKRVVGNGLPKNWMGFTNTFNYKNFDLTVFFRGAFGFDIINTQRLFFENKNLLPNNLLKSALSSPVLDDPQYSDYYIEKGDYIKLDNVTIGYSLPSKISWIKNLRVYAAGQNLVTFTGYKGQDPEISISGLTPGLDTRFLYPSVKTFSVGLSAKF